MTLAASSLLVTLLLPAASGAPLLTADPVPATVALGATVATEMVAPTLSPSPVPAPALAAPPAAFRAWPQRRRPGALTGMYVTYGTLQMLDIYSTRRAIHGGAVEANPVMRPFVGNTAAMVALKGVSTAISVYCAEKAWKRNRKAAVILMAALNGATALVVRHNMQQSK